MAEQSRIKRRGVELQITVEGKNDLPSADPVLLRAVARARRWLDEMASGQVRSSAEIARREGLQKGYVARLTRLALLGPGNWGRLALGGLFAAGGD